MNIVYGFSIDGAKAGFDKKCKWRHKSAARRYTRHNLNKNKPHLLRGATQTTTISLFSNLK